jgi:succinate dehydrogenase/fumarate reductase iron-sulfur protein
MNITVQRFDPSTDSNPYDSVYEVPWREKMTALEALVYIYENYEAVAFDYSCHGRTCGRCAMMVDGMPELACITVLDDSDHRIEPLAGFPVLHDLIVDKTSLHRSVASVYERVRFDDLSFDELNVFDNMEHADDVRNIEFCTRCGRCTSVCPAHNAAGSKYVGPMTMLATAYRHYDPYDQSDRVLEAVNEGIFDCIECGLCTQVCNSSEIDHVAYWQDLKAEATERGLVPRSAK